MKTPMFATLFSQLPLLNQPQRQELLAALHPPADLDRITFLVDGIRSRVRCCPACGCGRCHGHGHANDLQPYRCCQ